MTARMPLEIVFVFVAFAAAALVVSLVRNRAGGSSGSTAVATVVVSSVAGAIGALGVSRGLPPVLVAMSGVVAVGLGTTVEDGILGKRPSLRVATAILVFVALAAASAGMWATLATGAVAALPFAVAAAFYPRADGPADALFSAVAGASLGLLPGILAVIVGSCAAVVLGRLLRSPARSVAFAPCVAAATSLGIVAGMVFLPG